MENPVGDTTTYAMSENSRDTGVTRVSVDNTDPAGSRTIPLLQRLDPSP